VLGRIFSFFEPEMMGIRRNRKRQIQSAREVTEGQKRRLWCPENDCDKEIKDVSASGGRKHALGNSLTSIQLTIAAFSNNIRSSPNRHPEVPRSNLRIHHRSNAFALILEQVNSIWELDELWYIAKVSQGSFKSQSPATYGDIISTINMRSTRGFYLTLSGIPNGAGMSSM
jgi:hypothetical protein